MKKNEELSKSFAKYCQEHPQERFWQALRNWSGYAFVCVSHVFPSGTDIQDTFYWEGKHGSDSDAKTRDSHQ